MRLRFERALAWILRSRARIAVTAILFGVSAFLLEFIIHTLVTGSGVSEPAHALVDSAVLGCTAALLPIVVLSAARERNRKLQDDLRRIAAVNHQIRNALQAIVYGAHDPASAECRAAVASGVERIEGALREIFPLVGERSEDRPWEEHNRARLIRMPKSERRAERTTKENQKGTSVGS